MAYLGTLLLFMLSQHCGFLVLPRHKYCTDVLIEVNHMVVIQVCLAHKILQLLLLDNIHLHTHARAKDTGTELHVNRWGGYAHIRNSCS